MAIRERNHIISADMGSTHITSALADVDVNQVLPETLCREEIDANRMSGLIIMAIAGGGIMPFLTGIIIDSFGYKTGIARLVLCAAYILTISFKIILKNRKSV